MQNASIFCDFVFMHNLSFAYGEPLAINPSGIFLLTKRQTTALVNEDKNIIIS